MRFNPLARSRCVAPERWLPLIAAVVVAAAAGRGAWLTFAPAADTSQGDRRRLEVTQVPRREQPLDITPHGAYRDMLTDEELGPIVASVEPSWTGPSMGYIVHSLRLWGADATFGPSWQFPGQPPHYLYPAPTQLKILLDHSEFERAFVRNFAMPTFLDEGEVGVSVLTGSDTDIGANQGQYHVDKVLQVLAEIGIPASTRVVPRSRSGRTRDWTIHDILNESLWKYSPYQEPEFTISAYARWLRPGATWENRFGVRYRLDDVVDRLLEPGKTGGACVGLHVMYALASVLRAHRVEPVISDATAERVAARLRRISQQLTDVQRSDGSWSLDWNGPFHRPPDNTDWYLDVPPYPEIYMTGHHLEWIALAPPEVGPSREVVRRAVDYLKTRITAMPLPFFYNPDVYPLGTHAARALCLIRGVAPWEIRQRYPVAPKGVENPSRRDVSSTLPKGDGA